jgi:3'-phosphoadenosine 5'-phosphosulfate sulfotransferase (PAPS reductase)/FAD synthetase
VQYICYNTTTGSGKIKYRSRAAATKKLKESHSGGLHIYECRFCGCWHLTSEAQRCKPATPPPSAKTLRGRIENAAKSIAAQRRYIERGDGILAAQTAKVDELKRKAEQDHAETLRYIEREIGRIVWSK